MSKDVLVLNLQSPQGSMTSDCETVMTAQLQCSRQNFEIGGCRGMESKVVLSDSIDYAIIAIVNLLSR